jgi:hypothetical protein
MSGPFTAKDGIGHEDRTFVIVVPFVVSAYRGCANRAALIATFGCTSVSSIVICM